jgi:hypothetical protein
VQQKITGLRAAALARCERPEQPEVSKTQYERLEHAAAFPHEPGHSEELRMFRQWVFDPSKIPPGTARNFDEAARSAEDRAHNDVAKDSLWAYTERASQGLHNLWKDGKLDHLLRL